MMKTKKGFRLRTVCGEHILVAEGLENIDFSSIISMNESSAYLWQKAEGQTFTEEDLTHWLMDEYEVSETTARADVATLVDAWKNAGIIETTA